MTFKTVYLKDITINLDSKRKPLNATERKALKGKNLYPYCGANGILDYIDEYIFDQEILCLAEDGGSWGYNEKCCYIMNEPCWVNNHAHVLAPKSNVNIKYLYYYLNYVDLNKYITGTTRGKLTKSALEKIQIKLPSLSNQNEIVDLLDKAQELIDKRNAQIEALDQLTQSVFLEMFGDPVTNPKGWDVCTFKDVSTVRQGLQIPISKRLKHKVENSYKYITVQYLNGHKEEEYIQNPKPNVICTKDDILMTRTGNTGMVISNVEGVFHNNFFLIDFNRKLFEKVFLIYYLNTEYIQWDLLRRAGNSTIPDLNHSEFYKISVYVPPLELQKIFANKIKRIEHQKELLKSGLLELENMYNALMQKAFKGELFTEDKVSNL